MIKREPHWLDTIITIIDANDICYDIALREAFQIVRTGAMDEFLPEGFVLNDEVKRLGLRGFVENLREVMKTDAEEAKRLETLLPRISFGVRFPHGERVPDGHDLTPVSYDTGAIIGGV